MSAPFQLRTREAREAVESLLSPAAARSVCSRGRRRAEEPDPLRTAFERDRDRILHSKAFRRLKHKTQVFVNPEGDHFVTRLTHTLQVTQIARSLASALGLNEALTEAIALGHDVGHAPFGHTGEDALSPFVAGGWHHAAQSVRIFEVLEDLNLSWEVRDGIRAHSWAIDPDPATAEARCVRYADRIAYLSHDVLDAIRAGALTVPEIPGRVRAFLGEPGSGWIGRMVSGVVDHTVAAGEVGMSPDALEAMHELRAFMFEHVYQAGARDLQRRAAVRVITDLVEYHLAHPDEIPRSYRDTSAALITQVVDFVSGATDRYALALHDRLFRPRLFEAERRAV